MSLRQVFSVAAILFGLLAATACGSQEETDGSHDALRADGPEACRLLPPICLDVACVEGCTPDQIIARGQDQCSDTCDSLSAAGDNVEESCEKSWNLIVDATTGATPTTAPCAGWLDGQ